MNTYSNFNLEQLKIYLSNNIRQDHLKTIINLLPRYDYNYIEKITGYSQNIIELIDKSFLPMHYQNIENQKTLKKIKN